MKTFMAMIATTTIPTSMTGEPPRFTAYTNPLHAACGMKGIRLLQASAGESSKHQFIIHHIKPTTELAPHFVKT